MADQKVTDLTELAEAPQDSDILEVVDTSDTTHDAAGTSKKLTFARIKTYVEAFTSYFNLSSNTSDDITEGSTNLFMSSAEQTKLSGVETGATADQTGAEIKAAYEAESDTNAFTDADHTKLDGIATGAEVNAVDSVNTQTGAVVLDADDIDDASTTHKFATAAQLTKVDGVEANATADQTDSEIETAYNNQVSQVSAGEKTAGTETGVRRFAPADVKSMIDTHGGSGGASELSDLSDVDSSVGSPSDGDILVYRSAGSDFVLEAKPAAGSNPAAADITDATADGIALITSSDANPFTDADETKLDGIEASADVTDTANVTAAGALMDSEVTNLAQVKAFDSADYATASHNHAASDINSGTFADARIAESNVTQHEAALTVTESQISDLGSYKTTGSDETANVAAASDTSAGKVELATTAETNTGTDDLRAITPDGLADSYAGTKSVQLDIFGDVATGDGQAKIIIPSHVNGMNLVEVEAHVGTAGTTGTLDIQVRNATDAVDVLSTKLTIDSGETSSTTAATAAVINTSNDDAATSDVWYVDIDAVQTTAPSDLSVVLVFKKP